MLTLDKMADQNVPRYQQINVSDFVNFFLKSGLFIIYNMRDWDSLQVPALAYDSLVWMKPEQSLSHELNIKLVSGNNEKKPLVFL